MSLSLGDEREGREELLDLRHQRLFINLFSGDKGQSESAARSQTLAISEKNHHRKRSHLTVPSLLFGRGRGEATGKQMRTHAGW